MVSGPKTHTSYNAAGSHSPAFFEKPGKTDSRIVHEGIYTPHLSAASSTTALMDIER